MALEQSGNVAGALDIWTDVLRTAPKDAHWIAGLRERIDELALLHSVDTKDQLRGVAELPTPSQRTGFTTPTSTEIASANALPEKERQAMIVGMVDGLEERLNNHPKDVEGWIRLIRSRLVLNDTNGAERALNRARLIFFEDPVANTRIIKAASNLGLQVN
ncbi:MAG: hypothetical protein GY952_10865 [Rhodobacteraceae bacterium]|nr:hypothetical protein [Paracoccaceae bacterium]